MEALVAFVAAHWLAVALAAYAIVSDVMPFLPTKANGIAQAVLNSIKWLVSTFKPGALPPAAGGAK